MFRPIRMDHTNCLQVAIKTLHSFSFDLNGGVAMISTMWCYIQYFSLFETKPLTTPRV